MNHLSFEDREVVNQTLTAAARHFTPRQCAVVGLYWGAGWTQARIGVKLGIHRSTVARHWMKAMEKVRRVGKSYTH